MSKLKARLLRSTVNNNAEQGEVSLPNIVCILGVVVVGSIMCNGVASIIQWQASEQQQILIEQPERVQE